MVRAIRLGARTSPLAAVLVIACWGASNPLAAQELPSVSRPVVQPLPRRDGMDLNAALGRLARDPRDVDALVDAGNAALVMGDIEAATGFFRRADQVSPANPRVKAGLAGALVHSGDPFAAIALFDEAEKAGAMDGALAADRGLAYDLVGDNASAQRYYRQSLARNPNDEVVRRLALSLAISGDKHGAEQTISPLLHQRNLAAWRTRAFSLAILGQTEEAVKVADSILPADLAASIAPYFRYMPRLTRAQQAAAASFGAFPRASEIGRDDPRIAQHAPGPVDVPLADAALVPRGQPLGRNARTRDRGRASRAEAAAATQAPANQDAAMTPRVAPPEPKPERAAPTAATVAPKPPPASIPQSERPAAVAIAQGSTQTAASVSPGFSLAPAAPAPRAATPSPAPGVSTPPVSLPQAAPARQVALPPPPSPRSLREVFAEFGRPSTDATPAVGAVDLRQIKPARPEVKKPAEPPKPPPPKHPSRIWVQVATGRDKDALGYDWRRMTRANADVFRGKDAYVSAWGQTNRLLTGPFPNEKAANSFIAKLRDADVDGPFVWTSSAGLAVDELTAETGSRR